MQADVEVEVGFAQPQEAYHPLIIEQLKDFEESIIARSIDH
jgi:hypothetical protein